MDLTKCERHTLHDDALHGHARHDLCLHHGPYPRHVCARHDLCLHHGPSPSHACARNDLHVRKYSLP